MLGCFKYSVVHQRSNKAILPKVPAREEREREKVGVCISDVDVMIIMQNTVSLYDCLLLYIRNEHKSRKESKDEFDPTYFNGLIGFAYVFYHLNTAPSKPGRSVMT